MTYEVPVVAQVVAVLHAVACLVAVVLLQAWCDGRGWRRVVVAQVTGLGLALGGWMLLGWAHVLPW